MWAHWAGDTSWDIGTHETHQMDNAIISNHHPNMMVASFIRKLV